MRRHWTNHEHAQLVQLAENDRLTADQISRRMPGRTRNAIIGRCFREGVKLALSPASVPKTSQQAAARLRRSYGI